MRLTLLSLLLVAGCGTKARTPSADLGGHPADLAPLAVTDSSTGIVDQRSSSGDLPTTPLLDLSVPPDLTPTPDLSSCLDQCVGDAGMPACCNGACVDTSNDPKNCGACGNDCGNRPCCAGFCADITQDVLNCGGCGMPCLGLHASWKCVASMCKVAGCMGQYKDCDQDSKNGCEQLNFCP